MSEMVIDIKGISKSFKSKEVLRNLSFSVPKGSVVGLLGKNGIGKTTLIKCALGLLSTQGGSAKIFNEDVWDLSAETKEKLGYVPQTASFYPWLNIQELIDYTASFYQNWDKSLSDQLLKQWELNPNDKVGVLSEGQTQRVSLILALGYRPELLILDEPIASLDPAARRQFLKTVLETMTDGKLTVLFSTHITSDLERIADRVAILGDRELLFSGELGQLKDGVKCLKVSSKGKIPDSTSMPGLIRSDVEGNEALLYVRDFNNEVKAKIEQLCGSTVEVQDLNLEEIFLEITR